MSINLIVCMLIFELKLYSFIIKLYMNKNKYTYYITLFIYNNHLLINKNRYLLYINSVI